MTEETETPELPEDKEQTLPQWWQLADVVEEVVEEALPVELVLMAEPEETAGRVMSIFTTRDEND